MKRSTYVQLILLGSAMGLYACDEISEDLKQQRYASLDECRRDWGDPADCRQAPVVTGQPFPYSDRVTTGIKICRGRLRSIRTARRAPSPTPISRAPGLSQA